MTCYIPNILFPSFVLAVCQCLSISDSDYIVIAISNHDEISIVNAQRYIFFFIILDSNPCEPNPCLHNSQCVLFPGFGKNHECNCSIGWSGNTCQSE